MEGGGEGGRRTSLSLSLSPSLPPSILPSLPLWADNDDDGDEGNLCESVQLSRVRVQRVRIDLRRRDSGRAALPSERNVP